MVARVKNKLFEQWLYEDVERSFGLTRLRKHPRLDYLKTLPFPEKAYANKMHIVDALCLDLLDNENMNRPEFSNNIIRDDSCLIFIL